jgi:hypothetical protein
MSRMLQPSNDLLTESVIKLWAQALFCSPARHGECIDVKTVCRAIAEELVRYIDKPGGIRGAFAWRVNALSSSVSERMAWCLDQASRAYTVHCVECQ